MTTANGTAKATQAKDLEIVPVKPVKPKRETKNPMTEVKLTLDAGSKRIKFLLDGYETTIDSVYKEVKGDLPSGSAGCFRYKNKNYYVGKGCDSVIGELVEGQKDNKIKKLDIWLIGALTSDTDFLDDLIEDKRNRYKGKPIRLSINVKLLSLSSNKLGDVKKILIGIDSFIYRGREFSVEFKNLDQDFIFDEGYGAALTARNHLPENIKEFSIVDLGGGTLTMTTYKCGRRLPKRDNRTVASGGGMQDLASKIFISLNKTDKGGETRSLEGVFQALKACKSSEDGFIVPYRVGSETANINDEVVDGLSHWVADNPSIANIFTKASQVLVSGGYVFATGGGFASIVIAAWIKGKLTTGIDNPHFQILENPQVINVTGMQLLDKG
ncbi:MAG: hypothetical protein HC874_24940 [Richelia sp. SL_2_1]|nr:hypothetical protein [Richelia sp. SM1_7_0]NJO30422.1 hypothetical protein [Richelia sp. SL_2_1]